MDPKRPLSEISHLFLSEIRARQPGGPRPMRVAPPRGEDISVDMTPEEFAASLDAEPTPVDATPEPTPHSKPACVSVVISAHLLEQSAPSVRQYARQLAAEAGHIGMIEADGAEFTVTCFEKDGGPAASTVSVEVQDARKISEVVNELAFDVDRWLICLPNARTPQTRELLRAAPHWVMLTTADHEGVVATYRALKGLSELGRRRVSLVVLDARDEAHADAVFRKLDAVSRQFLHCGLETGSLLRPAQNITEHSLLHCRQAGDRTGSGPDFQWRIIRELMTNATGPTLQPKSEQSQAMKLNIPENQKMPAVDNTLPEVIDLPGDASERSILDAIIRQGGADGRWVTCPIHPPMCPEALLAVGRDQRLMLLAVAGRGLGQLLSIGQAHRWMSENGELIRMALPQLAIDATLTPAVTLLVDHNDLSAEVLQPLLQTGTVTVQAYRKVKWGAKTGLLLEAA
jgi:hypothetical protein